MTVHIHYPRIWNSVQVWSIDIDTKKAQVYFVFEHKNFFQGKIFFFLFHRFRLYLRSALINDWASSTPPDIYSFVPYIYDMKLKGNHVEVLIPCNQGNWIDCVQSSENSK
jgi:hypothetical protein